MADITLKKRASIFMIHEHCQALTRDIAKLCNVDQTTLVRIIKQFKETVSLTLPPPQKSVGENRKLKTTTRDDAYLLKKSKLDPRKTGSDQQ